MDDWNADRLEQLADIASDYFEKGLTQAEIAAKNGYSASMISRLLLKARELGVVEIKIHHPLRRRMDLEDELQDLLGLKVVRVLVHDVLPYPQMLRQLGGLAARLVEELIRDNITIGVAWGPAVYETINAIRPGICTGAHVVQMIGSIGTLEPQIDGQELARRLARALIGYYTPLHAPLFVDSESTRESLLNDPQIQRVFEQFKKIEMALVGVGTLDPDHSSLVQAGYLNGKQLEELEQYGAVGDVCALDFDLYGNMVDVPLLKRIIGIDATTLAAIPLKIGIAGGPYKVLPIIGASRAGLVDMLVIDEMAATSALNILRRMVSWREEL
jgi:deoxyribonucleoside regulator